MQQTAVVTLRAVDFDRLVLHGVLGMLLFAGALHVNLDDLRRHAVVVGVLSMVVVIISTGVVGWLTWQVLVLLGIPLPLVDCLLFGALISPTDPIAVLAVIRSLPIPKDLQVQLAAESLFNDGIGGVIFGVVIGTVAFLLIKPVNDYLIEILLSLALVLGGYAVAESLRVSAPMAIVVAGLLIGNHGRAFAMSDETRARLDMFWEVIDEMLNAVLFILVAGAVAVAVTLVARWFSLAVPLTVLRCSTRIATPSVGLMTWAAVRGPLSIALALSLYQRIAAAAPSRTHVIVVMTYAVVIFSVAVQGLTLHPLMRRTAARDRRQLTASTRAP